MEKYTLHHQNTIAQYIATCPILELCLEAEQRPGFWVARRWWEHGVLELKGVRAAASAVEEHTKRAEDGDEMSKLSGGLNVATNYHMDGA